jgi:hypothetical protein
MRETAKIGRKIGGVLGMIGFLVFGLIPGFYFGSFGTLVVLKHLLGPVEANVLTRVIVVVGTLMGLFCMASVCIVLGAVFGTAVGYMTEAFTAPAQSKETEEVKTN